MNIGNTPLDRAIRLLQDRKGELVQFRTFSGFAIKWVPVGKTDAVFTPFNANTARALIKRGYTPRLVG